jgi:spore coat protein U-like protein
MNRSARLLLIVFALCLGSTHAHAALSCTPTATSLVFGDVSSAVVNNQAADTTATISYTCTGASHNSTIRVCLELDYFNASNTRSMTSGGNTLNYQIYKDSARTQVWGNGTDGNVLTVDLAADNAGNASGSSTMYGRILTGQTTAPTGSYSHSMPGSSDNRLTVAQGTASPCTSITSGSKTFSLTNTATISNYCTVSATTLAFGSVANLSSVVTSTNTVSALCSSGTAYNIGLDGGTTGATDPTLRKMSFSTNQITYGIYRSSGTTQPWGSTIGTNTASGTGSGLTQNYTGFGRVPVQSQPNPGNYSDTVVVTVTY